MIREYPQEVVTSVLIWNLIANKLKCELTNPGISYEGYADDVHAYDKTGKMPEIACQKNFILVKVFTSKFYNNSKWNQENI